MKLILFTSALSVRRSAIQGYGVFAEQAIAPDDIIEECRTIILNDATLHNELSHYCFDGGDNNKLVVFGCGSLYNHSQQPNAAYTFDEKTTVMVFRATAPIQKGEEIFISYGKHWFSERGIKPLELSWRIKTRPFVSLLRMLFRFALVAGILAGILMYVRL